MFDFRQSITVSVFGVVTSLVFLADSPAQAVTIYASGQRLIPAVPGVHDDLRENFIYAIVTVSLLGIWTKRNAKGDEKSTLIIENVKTGTTESICTTNRC